MVGECDYCFDSMPIPADEAVDEPQRIDVADVVPHHDGRRWQSARAVGTHTAYAGSMGGLIPVAGRVEGPASTGGRCR